ncbi:hypothetical protein TNCV_4837821 [Trichonephila clavipes]|nr:hypothetical protein TNCV_4837821 [Trichonephila clavipes]
MTKRDLFQRLSAASESFVHLSPLSPAKVEVKVLMRESLTSKQEDHPILLKQIALEVTNDILNEILTLLMAANLEMVEQEVVSSSATMRHIVNLIPEPLTFALSLCQKQ